MTGKLKLAAIGLALLISTGAVFYLQSLRAQVNQLSLQAAQYKTVLAAQSQNLEQMRAASLLLGRQQAKARAAVNAMNQELASARGESSEENNDERVAGVLAVQLNRLFNP